MLADFATEWALVDPEAASALLIANRRAYLIGVAAERLTTRAPERSLELLEIWKRDAAEGRGFDPFLKTIRTIYADLALADRDRALAEVESLPTPLRAAAFEGIATVMAQADMPAALEWVESLSESKERTAALGVIAIKLAETDPDSAVPLLNQIGGAFGWHKPGVLVPATACDSRSSRRNRLGTGALWPACPRGALGSDPPAVAPPGSRDHFGDRRTRRRTLAQPPHRGCLRKRECTAIQGDVGNPRRVEFRRD